MRFHELRHQMLEVVRKLCEDGLIRLSAGNISARTEGGLIAITPSGLPYDRMRPEDIVVIDPKGRLVDGRNKPSSETPMHTVILRRMPDVGAVVHTHSPYAIAFACTGCELPVICTELLAIGGPVPVAPYACPGSAQAGQMVVDTYASRPGLKCLLLRNHGSVAIGANLNEAYQNAYKLEMGAQVYHLALQSGRSPILLTNEQIRSAQHRE